MNFFEGIISGGGGYWEEDNLYEFSHEYQCYRLEMLVYLFSVDDVKIQKINNSWVVTDWKQICQRIENEPMKC